MTKHYYAQRLTEEAIGRIAGWAKTWGCRPAQAIERILAEYRPGPGAPTPPFIVAPQTARPGKPITERVVSAGSMLPRVENLAQRRAGAKPIAR